MIRNMTVKRKKITMCGMMIPDCRKDDDDT